MIAFDLDGVFVSELVHNSEEELERVLTVRAEHLGKRFTRLKRAMGFDDRHVFHSIRKTVVTMLEHAGVPESTVQDIVGHERSTLTGSIYSGKSTLAMRHDALAQLDYPAY